MQLQKTYSFDTRALAREFKASKQEELGAKVFGTPKKDDSGKWIVELKEKHYDLLAQQKSEPKQVVSDEPKEVLNPRKQRIKQELARLEAEKKSRPVIGLRKPVEVTNHNRMVTVQRHSVLTSQDRGKRTTVYVRKHRYYDEFQEQGA